MTKREPKEEPAVKDNAAAQRESGKPGAPSEALEELANREYK